jgi:UPF0271 protein
VIVDLNCDLGEECGDDAAILPHVTSASVACAQHAGSPSSMRATVNAAAAAGVAVGAHPSFPDRQNFGRQDMQLPADAIHDLVLYQIGALEVFCRQAGVRLQHVKPHGALYHVGARRPEAAEAIARAVHAAGRDLILVGPPGSALAAAAAAAGLRFAGELFADRQYGEDGLLLPRSDPRALIALDHAAAAARAVQMIRSGQVVTASNTMLPQTGHTICLHGDTPDAAARAQAVRAALEAAGIRVAPLGAWL